VSKIYRLNFGIGLLFFVLLVASCGDKSTNPKQVGQIWPLAIGNQWSFQLTEFDTNTVVISIDTLVLEVVKDTIIHNETFYLLTANGVRDPEVRPMTNREDGLWDYRDSDTIIILIKYPVTVGESFFQLYDSLVVVSTDTLVTVPAGSFHCVRYDDYLIATGRLLTHIYAAPNVGLVKKEDFSLTPGDRLYLSEVMELISYVLQ
jgi:hypothetical protein